MMHSNRCEYVKNVESFRNETAQIGVCLRLTLIDIRVLTFSFCFNTKEISDTKDLQTRTYTWAGLCAGS